MRPTKLIAASAAAIAFSTVALADAPAPLNDANNRLRFRAQGGAAGFIGVSQEFWVLDRADDYSWAILGTPGGNYFWLWSRSHSPANRAALLARVRALGYDTSNVVHVGA